jgi:hypothetical protein
MKPFGWVNMPELTNHFEKVSCGTIYKVPGEGRMPLYAAPLICRENLQVADHETIYNLKASAPPECQTEAEKTAYAFGWWQAWEKKKKWVGLTADEENEIAEDWWKDRLPDIHSVIKTIEAKLKERNT